MKIIEIILFLFEFAATLFCVNARAIVNGDTARVHVALPYVSKLGKIESAEVIVRGIRWKVVVERIGDSLAVFLQAPDDVTKETDGVITVDMTYDVEATFGLLTFDPTGRPYKKAFAQHFQWGISKRGLPKFIEWHDFIGGDKKLVLDDKANLIVEFKVGEPIPLLERPNALFR